MREAASNSSNTSWEQSHLAVSSHGLDAELPPCRQGVVGHRASALLQPTIRAMDRGHITMDILRDRQVLEEMVERGEAPWRVQPDPLDCVPVSVKS
jgi:hypothetical protein